jgi:hypothetical protein
MPRDDLFLGIKNRMGKCPYRLFVHDGLSLHSSPSQPSGMRNPAAASPVGSGAGSHSGELFNTGTAKHLPDAKHPSHVCG